MTGRPARPAATAEPGGLVVAVCTGHRCAALRRLDGEEDLVGASLRDAVVASRGGVLIASPCLGVCARAPAAAVGYRAAGQHWPSSVVRLGDLDAGRRAALAAWVAGTSGGTAAGTGAGTAAGPAGIPPLPVLLMPSVEAGAPEPAAGPSG